MIFRMAFLMFLASACTSSLSITTITPPHFTSLPVLVSGAFISSNTCTSCASAGILLNDISPFPAWAIPMLLIWTNVASSTFFYFCLDPYLGATSVLATIQIAAKSNNHDCLYCRGVVFVSSLLDKLLYTLSACMLFASLFLCCSCCMLSWWLLQFLPL